jgi:hypothetical protein
LEAWKLEGLEATELKSLKTEEVNKQIELSKLSGLLLSLHLSIFVFCLIAFLPPSLPAFMLSSNLFIAFSAV